MERIWTCSRPPKKVIEEKQIHYFYWKLESGVAYVSLRIGGVRRRIPAFFLKANDYEPVMRMDPECASRFHYDFLTLFKRPKIIDGRPVVKFVTGAHVPVLLSDYPKRLHSNFNKRDLDFGQTYSVKILMWLLRNNCWKHSGVKLKDYDVSSETVPKDALFQPSKLSLVVEISQ